VNAKAARVVVAAVAGALIGAAAAAIAYAVRPALVVEMLEDRAAPWPAIRGLYPADHEGRVTYSWSMGQVDVRLPELDRRLPWRMVVRVKAGRPEPLPTIESFVDGLRADVRLAPRDFEEFAVRIPSRPTRRGLTAFVVVTPTLPVGGEEPRQLGVMIDRIALERASSALPLVPIPTILAAAAVGALFGAAGAVLGLGIGLTAAVVVPTAGLAAVVATHGLGPFMPYTDRVVPLAAWSLGVVALALAAASALGRRAPDVVTRGAGSWRPRCCCSGRFPTISRSTGVRS
jgi:hypothetical protein